MGVDLPMLVPSALSLCCVAGTRPTWRSWVPAVVMVVAMAIAAIPGRDPGAVLLAALATLASAGLVLRRPGGRALHPMDAHRALSAVLMAGLLAVSVGGHPSAGHHAGAVMAVLVAGVGGYLGFSGWLAVSVWRGGREARRRPAGRVRPSTVRFVAAVEVLAMGVAVASMAVM